MSLRPSAPEFQPQSKTISKDTHVISIPELGYEFPYTMTAMPIRITPSKRMWSEMATSIKTYLKRYY